jgi:hypothetical protein
MSRKCVDSPHLFCDVCGDFTPTVKKAYELNLAIKFGIRTPAGHHIHVAVDVHDIYVAAHWHSPSNAFRSPCGAERTRSSYRLHDEPTSISPEDKPGPSCSNVDQDFPELTVPYLISLSELNDLVTDLNLLKIQAELLAPRTYSMEQSPS